MRLFDRAIDRRINEMVETEISKLRIRITVLEEKIKEMQRVDEKQRGEDNVKFSDIVDEWINGEKGVQE